MLSLKLVTHEGGVTDRGLCATRGRRVERPRSYDRPVGRTWWNDAVSNPEKLPRPPQVTMVGWMIVVGSVFVVFSAVETLGAVRSLESLERLEEYLTDGPGAALGWSIETGVRAMRIAATLTAACAAAAAVLGWYVLRRHHGARIGMTVLAVPLFFSGAVTGGFVSSMVAAAAVLLWLQPSRDWFDGKPMVAPTRDGRFDRNPDRTTGQGSDRSHDQAGHHGWSHPPVAPPSSDAGGGRPVQGFGDPAGGQVQPSGAPQGQAQQGQWVGPYAAYATPRADVAPTRRPRAVFVAALVTFVFAGFFLVSALSILGLLGSSTEQVLEQLGPQRDELLAQGIGDDELVVLLRFSAAMLAVVTVVALVAAVLAVRRSQVGRVLLLVTASLAAAFCLLSSFVSPVMVLPGLGALVVVMMLVRPDVRAWFNTRS